MPLILQVTQSPVSATVCAAWAWAASTSSIKGGLNREANCTAANMAAKSTQVANVEGPICGRAMVMDSSVIALFAVKTRITAVVYRGLRRMLCAGGGLRVLRATGAVVYVGRRA